MFWLPVTDANYIISVASTPLGTGVFAPHVTLLDASGAPLREIARDKIVFRGNDLSVLFRSHPNERYLLVASDPGSVGQSVEQVKETTGTTTMAGGLAYFSYTTGDDTTKSYVYAHSGQITVTVSAIEPAK